MAARRRHHVVSRGYQRFFAEGERILLFDKFMRSGRVVGTRDGFVERDFNSYQLDGQRLDDLEDEWSRLEGHVLPGVAAAIAGEHTPDTRQAIKVLAAIHFARSYGVDVAQRRIAAEALEDAPAEFLADPEFRELFVAEYGYEPDVAEVDRLLREGHGQWSSAFRAGRMARAHGFVLEKLDPLHVQLLLPLGRSIEFVTGDTPLVHTDRRRLKVGLRDRLALGDASTLYMPLGRRLAALFTTTNEGDQRVAPATVQRLNQLTWRAAHRYLAAHPSVDVPRAVAMTSPS